jgi:diguanylate cyclase (GGDEF)-like protein
MRRPVLQLRGKLVLSFSAVVVVLTGALGLTIYATFSTSLRSAHEALVEREADAVAGGILAVVRELEAEAVQLALAPWGPGVAAPAEQRAERVALAVARAPAVAGVLVVDAGGRPMARVRHVPAGAVAFTAPGFHVTPEGAVVLSVALSPPVNEREAAGLHVALDREQLAARASVARGNGRAGVAFRVGPHDIFRVEPDDARDAAAVAHALGVTPPEPPRGVRPGVQEQGAALVTWRTLPLLGGRLGYSVPSAVLHSGLRELRDRILVVSAVTLCLAIWLVELVASRISRPLRRLARAAHDMRELDYTTRIEALRARDEIGDLAQAFQALRLEVEASVTKDPLTGVYNRRFLMHTMETELARARRGGHAVACLLLDIDHFKRVNDVHGHLVGDAVLVALGRILLDAVRTSDVVARYGGEEFVVFAVPIEESGVRVLAERVREAVAAAEIPFQPGPDAVEPALGGTLRCTVSVGAAVSPGGLETPAALLERADAALYAAKRAGRDRVVLAPTPTRGPVVRPAPPAPGSVVGAGTEPRPS